MATVDISDGLLDQARDDLEIAKKLTRPQLSMLAEICMSANGVAFDNRRIQTVEALEKLGLARRLRPAVGKERSHVTRQGRRVLRSARSYADDQSQLWGERAASAKSAGRKARSIALEKQWTELRDLLTLDASCDATPPEPNFDELRTLLKSNIALRYLGKWNYESASDSVRCSYREIVCGAPDDVMRWVAAAEPNTIAALIFEMDLSRTERAQAESLLQSAKLELAARRRDERAAAGELGVALPEPGTDASKLLIANRLMRRELEHTAALANAARAIVRKGMTGELMDDLVEALAPFDEKEEG